MKKKKKKRRVVVVMKEKVGVVQVVVMRVEEVNVRREPGV
jgi:hypothetical protein